MKRLNITVTGKVQGVFFRDTARRAAGQLGLAGFARNEPDGSVYIEAEGDDAALQEFIAWCWDGPKHATVERVIFSEHDPVGYKEFEIK